MGKGAPVVGLIVTTPPLPAWWPLSGYMVTFIREMRPYGSQTIWMQLSPQIPQLGLQQGTPGEQVV